MTIKTERIPLTLLAACALLAFSAAAKNPLAGMVLVPAGSFTMGSNGKARDENVHERPQHKVKVGAFYIDIKEVSVNQYVTFLNDVKRTHDSRGNAFLGDSRYAVVEKEGTVWKPKEGKGRHAMVNVTWYGAAAYAEWAGKRLPTEAEWEKAARGTDARKFPWGDQPNESRLRFGQEKVGLPGTHVDGASPYGCLDMVGNAWEWTSSLFVPYPFKLGDGRQDVDSAERRVARGGSWNGEPHIFTTTYRFHPLPSFAHRYLGFRCVKSAQ